MQALGYLTLGILLLMMIEQGVGLSNPCSQFSDPDRQSLCSSDDYPADESADE